MGGVGPYAASKVAATRWAETFAAEQKAWGIEVTILEPNYFKTRMVETIVEDSIKSFEDCPQHVQDKYGREFIEGRMAVVAKKISGAADPMVVVDYIIASMTNAESLPIRQYVGENYRPLRVLECLPYEWQFYGMYGMFMMGGPMPAAFSRTSSDSKKED